MKIRDVMLRTELCIENLNFSDLNFKFLLKFVAAFFFVLGFSSCGSKGNLTGSGKNQTSLSPIVVNIPTVIDPLEQPYYSKNSVVTIFGQCSSGSMVEAKSVIGLRLGFASCANSEYSIDLFNNADGIYTYFVSQTTADGATSSPAIFTWIKKTSISIPVITYPASDPFLSSSSSLTIQGSCENGAEVTLLGDGVGSDICENSQFAITLPKSVDGNYNLEIKQTDSAGNHASKTISWHKLALAATPADPTLQVATSQTFAISGGSGSYTLSLSQNNSSATFDAINKIYTAGTQANVIDKISVVDSLGDSIEISIHVIAGDADHLSFASSSGDNQVAPVGSLLTLPFKAIVVDKYENPIPNYPIYIQRLLGDSQFKSPVIQLSNISGEVTMAMQAGFASLKNKIEFSPVATTLPDLAGSGRARLTFEFTLSNINKNYFGPTFNIGQNGIVTRLADANGDSILDAFVLNSGDPSIGILLGLGNGLFSTMTKINSICGTPNDMVVADFNSDGASDIAITCGNSLTVAIQVYLGNGDSTFSAAQNLAIDASESIPNALIASDLNHDGILDLATTNAGSANVSIRAGQGGAVFSAPVFVDLLVGASPSGLAPGDFDKDGKTDILVLNSALDSMTILQGLVATGAVSYDASLVVPVGTSPVAVAVRDFNADGFDDLAVLNTADSAVSIQINDHTGLFNELVALPVGSGPSSLNASDLNGDGADDVAVTNQGSDNSLNVFLGRGNGLFDTMNPIAVVDTPTYVSSALVNGDNQKDLIVIGQGTQKLQVLPGQSGNVFGYVTAALINPTDAVFSDFNSDNKIDAAVLSTGSKSIDIFYGDGQGLFLPTSATLGTNDNSIRVAMADFRNSGRHDFVSVNPSKSNIRIYLQNASGTWGSPNDITVGASPSDIVIQDLNYDGYADILVSNSGSNSASVMLGVGDGSFLAKQDFLTGGTPTAISLVDLNSDSNLDIVVANKTSNSVGVLLGNGDGTFQTMVDYLTGTSPVALKIADFNNDGFLDVVSTNAGDNTIAVIFGNGDGSLRSPNFYSAGLNPDRLVMGDFTGDGKVDLAVANGVNEAFTILTGTANGQFNVSTNYDTGHATSAILSSDFNGDQALDLMVFDSTANSFHVWLGH